MENQTQIFNNEQFGNVRIIEEAGKFLFCGSDVAKALGYARPNDAIAAHCRYTAKRSIPHPQAADKQIDMIFIPEGDVYRLITHSKLPDAEKFERWVFDEILPAIRKTGGYIAGEENMTDDELVAKALIITTEKLKQREARIAALSAQIEEDQPYTRFGKSISASDAAILLGDFAKVAANSGIPIGRNRLFKWLRDNKYLMPDNKPYQRYVDQGVFAVKENKVFTGFEETIRTTTLVTGKGQKYLMERLEAGA